jgi:hypothetical protein
MTSRTRLRTQSWLIHSEKRLLFFIWWFAAALQIGFTAIATAILTNFATNYTPRITESDTGEMIGSLRMSELFRGRAGSPCCDVKSLLESTFRAQPWLKTFPRLPNSILVRLAPA